MQHSYQFSKVKDPQEWQINVVHTLPGVRPTAAVMTALPVVFETHPQLIRSRSVAKTIMYSLYSGRLQGRLPQCTWQLLSIRVLSRSPSRARQLQILQ